LIVTIKIIRGVIGVIKEVPYNQYMVEVDKKLTSRGIFLTSKADKINTMVIGWGGITFFWGKPVFFGCCKKVALYPSTYRAIW